MEFLKDILASVFPYVLSVVIAAWITLYFMVGRDDRKNGFKPSKAAKLITPAVWGLILGLIWYFFIGAKLDELILGFFASAGFYDYIVKWLLDKLNIKY